MKKKTIVIFALSVVLICSLALSGQAADLFSFFGSKKETVTIDKEEYERLKRFEKLADILEIVQEYFYEDADEDAMLEMAAYGLLAGLDDPYTFYYSQEDWQQMQEDDEGEYGGIGIQMLGNYTDDTVTVTRVFKNTPAERAGIMRGDLLVRVEDIDVNAESMQMAVSYIRGEIGTPVEVEVIRDGESLVFTVDREMIHVNRVEYKMLDSRVGYIYLYEFAGDCADMFADALKDLEAQGAASIVLDLRDNGGGDVADAVNIADLFLEDQLLFYAEDKYGNRDNYYTKAGSSKLPLVILVNEYSASASEILSGSLHCTGRAELIGVNTYGKGIMQWVIPLEGGDGMQITFAQYFLSDGTAVHKIGIAPDIEVTMPEDMSGTYLQFGDLADPQLKAAWEEAVRLSGGN